MRLAFRTHTLAPVIARTHIRVSLPPPALTRRAERLVRPQPVSTLPLQSIRITPVIRTECASRSTISRQMSSSECRRRTKHRTLCQQPKSKAQNANDVLCSAFRLLFSFGVVCSSSCVSCIDNRQMQRHWLAAFDGGASDTERLKSPFWLEPGLTMK